ncbi:MAG: Na+/H+ antiporter NhaA [Chitinophagaceae bacterium]|nr:Na+/H+ antiporter NhaA [Chitinophagaceae bacterium]
MARQASSNSIVNFLHRFINDSRSVGALLFISSVLSIIIANGSGGGSYIDFWDKGIASPSGLHLPHSILHWINDGLMALFFFLVGMEIKRELVAGELSSLKKSLLPLFAALGGMLVPAGIYAIFNSQTEYHHGWGIPMATDIAFSLGVAAMLGKKVPVGLKTFLMALAIIDDLGAIVVIALFYGSNIQWLYIIAAAAITVALFLFPRLKIKFGWWNFLLGIVLWYCLFNSGIHATIAGVLLALTIPLDKLDHLIHQLHVPVNFFVLPVFAFANTAILIPAEFLEALNTSLNHGIMGGLFLGKPIGILLACWILVKLKWGELPRNTTWTQLAGIGVLAGIGFTMSIFITMLAFNDPASQDMAKSGVLVVSVLAMIVGYIWLSLASPKAHRD